MPQIFIYNCELVLALFTPSKCPQITTDLQYLIESSWIIYSLTTYNSLLCYNRFRVSLDLVSVQGAKAPKWNEKSSLAFWRGRDSRQERLDLVRMSMKYPDIIDARLTNMFFFKKENDLGELVKHISFFDFFKVRLLRGFLVDIYPAWLTDDIWRLYYY